MIFATEPMSRLSIDSSEDGSRNHSFREYFASFGDYSERDEQGNYILIAPSFSDERLSCCEAVRAAFCCIAPNKPNGKCLRNELACLTWTTLSGVLLTGNAFLAHKVVMGKIFLCFSGIAGSIDSCCCYFATNKINN